MNKVFVNEDIFAKKVVVIDVNGAKIGEMNKFDAIKHAREQGLDLVQIQPPDEAGRSLCKVMDYGKMKYEQSKHKAAKNVKEKEIFFHVGTAQHDLDTKKNHVKGLLAKGARVKFGIELRRREKQFSEDAKEMLRRCVIDFQGLARWDDIKSSDRFIFVMLQPIAKAVSH